MAYKRSTKKVTGGMTKDEIKTKLAKTKVVNLGAKGWSKCWMQQR